MFSLLNFGVLSGEICNDQKLVHNIYFLKEVGYDENQWLLHKISDPSLLLWFSSVKYHCSDKISDALWKNTLIALSLEFELDSK